MTHGPLSWRELVERDKQKSKAARGQIKRAAMPVQAEPVAWMYGRDDGSRDLLLDCNGEYARNLLELGATETPLYAHPPAPQWQGIESAPRDGTRMILAKFVGHPAHDTALWWAVAGHWSDKWQNWNDGVEPCGLAGPTHWMPLPTPPAGGSDAE